MSQPGFLKLLPLLTDRLRLRPFALDDAEALYQLHRDPTVTRYAGGTMTRDESHGSLRRIINRVETTGFGALAVEELDASEVVGWSGIQQMVDRDGYELIYAFRADKWGQGYATETSLALVETCFALSEPVIDVIHGLVYRDNQRSIKVLEKIGMSRLGDQLHAATQQIVYVYAVDRAAFRRRGG